MLPFDNISPDQETDYSSDGLTEELIARLSVVNEIELVSRYIVGGSVRRFQRSVRITVQIVDALKLKLSFSEKVSLTKRQTVNAQAYDLYLRGQDYLYRLTKRSVEYAIQLFEKAIELDPRYAAAYAACSSAYGQMYQWFSRAEQHRDKAQELRFKALMYDSNLPEAYAAMVLSYFIWGKFDEASASSRTAIELDPDDFIAFWTLGRIHFTNGELEQALAPFRRVIELKPGFYAAYADLAQTCAGLGRKEEAEEASRQLLELLPNYLLQNPDDSRARMYYAIALAENGLKEDAVREGGKALELSPGDPMMLYNCACLYSQLGEVDRAVDTLRQAIAGGYENFGWMKHDPDLDALRGYPGFIAMVEGK